MIEGSSALNAARKAWRERKSDGRNCYDEAGELVECQAPPSWVLSEVDLPEGMPAASRYTQVNEYVRRAVKHEHIYSVDDPDE